MLSIELSIHDARKYEDIIAPLFVIPAHHEISKGALVGPSFLVVPTFAEMTALRDFPYALVSKYYVIETLVSGQTPVVSLFLVHGSTGNISF